ncbi:putative zinc protease [Abditibacteriota bacterium]|nr:putative zinc protease [Abditibacteriota bacterium]
MKIFGPSLSTTFLLTLSLTQGFSVRAQPLGAAKLQAATPAQPTRLNGVQETELPNGLKVLTKEVHTAPVVYFSVWYKAGSANEQLGQSGMSHLLEHMMFKGTKTRKPGEISAMLQQNGAQFNATTFFDRTNYFETLASDRLELAMKLESDRMVNSLFDESEHQKEMTVVRSEYEGGENNPGSALTKAVRLAAYQVHPYRWTTIGFRSDIENISRDEMYAYYKKYYVPNNATIVMVGDFDTTTALANVQKYFGSIPRRSIEQSFITPEPEQQGERRVTVRRAGTVGQVEIAYHIPAFGNPDRYVFDVLEGALSGGRTARFFGALVQSGLASSAYAYDYGLRDADLISLSASAQPGKTNAELEKALLAEVEKLQNTPISADELKRAINQAEAAYIFSQDSVQAQGSQLGENAMRGDWRYGETYLENLRRVTPADVQRVARQYMVERNRTVGYFEPILPGAATPQVRTAANTDTPAPINPILLTPAVKTNAAPQTVAAPARPTPTKSTRVVLGNGLTVVVQENHANPTVAVSGALLSAGAVFDPADKPGLADFTASQLSRGTQTRSLLDIARTLEDVGASTGVSGGQEYASVSGRSLSRDFDTMLDVLADEMRNPSFPADELEKARQQTLAGLEEARQDTGTLSDIAFMNALYPAGHPYHSPTLDEQTAVIKNLKREDLVAFHSNHYAPERLVMTVVGDVDTAKAIASITKAFGRWAKKGNLPAISIPDVGAMAGKAATANAVKPVVIAVPDKAQADVIYGYAGHLKRSDPEFYRVVVLNTIMGSGLASRLGVNVRDRLGLVYGISSATDASLGAGPFAVRFGSNPQNVDKAVAETRRQLTLAHDQGFSKEEVEKAISYITGTYAVTLSTNAAVAGQLLVAEVYGLGSDYIQKRNGYYQGVTVEQVNAAATKYLDPTLGTLVISGTYPAKQ